MTEKTIVVPDLGSMAQATLLEWQIEVGQQLQEEDAMAILESDKASMDLPCPEAGEVIELLAKPGDVLKVGDALLRMHVMVKAAEPLAVEVPDLGAAGQGVVSECLIKVGDHVQAEQALLTLESDKASMDIPAPQAGEVISWHVAVGETLKQGHLIAMLSPDNAAEVTEVPKVVDAPAVQVAEALPMPEPVLGTAATSPIVRRLAFELDINLETVCGTGKKARITKADLLAHIKKRLKGGPEAKPLPDFSAFGKVSKQDIMRIKQISAEHLHGAWQRIPHVTHFFEADISDLEALRATMKAEVKAKGARLTPLVFIMLAFAKALKKHPAFAASLSEDGQSLWLKHYCHLGIAVDTPKGLVVPVVRDVADKSLLDLALELAAVSEQARSKGLSVSQMQGGCATISSLGGIGGQAFTPIINHPEVCILGVAKAYQKPVWQDSAFVPRYTLPMSLSYDHRVIDGAEAARFCRDLQGFLEVMHQAVDNVGYVLSGDPL